MRIEVRDPLRQPYGLGPNGRRNYQPKIQKLLENPQTWLAVRAEDVAGKNNSAKQIASHQAARNRGLRVQTTVQGEDVFVRLIEPVSQVTR